MIPGADDRKAAPTRDLVPLLGCAVVGWATVQVVGRTAGVPGPEAEEYFLTWPVNPAYSGPAAIVTVAVHFLAGLAAGLAMTQLRALAGVATVALFPLVIVVEVAVEPTSHNLLPCELAMYAVMAVPGVVGSGLAAWLRRKDTPPGAMP
jgi:hypothetical protein